MKIISTKKHGFSLLEILLATAIFATGFGTFQALISLSLEKRIESNHLLQQAFLAEAKMNEIKTISKAKNDTGFYEAFPKYEFQYSITEETLNPMTEMEKIIGKDEDILKSLEDLGITRETATGFEIKMLHYHVKVFAPNNDQPYQLHYYSNPEASL